MSLFLLLTIVGDGIVDIGEECDGADLGGMTCILQGYHGGNLLCNEHCQFVLTDCEVTGSCGDGQVQGAFEDCEAGDIGDCGTIDLGRGEMSCDENCHWDKTLCTGKVVCGDGFIDPYDEDCEGNDLNNQSCELLGYYGGTLSCSDCKFELSNCRQFGICGDNLLNSDKGEECDGDNLNNQTCETLGYYGGELSCNNNCSFDFTSCQAAGMCGDGNLDFANGEECDTTQFGTNDCTSFGGYRGTLTCTNQCEVSLENCERCGDGVAQPSDGESCDIDDLSGESCQTLNYYGGTLACNSTCGFDFSNCEGYCQDGVVQTNHGETCDGTNFNGKTCSIGGSLTCGNDSEMGDVSSGR